MFRLPQALVIFLSVSLPCLSLYASQCSICGACDHSSSQCGTIIDQLIRNLLAASPFITDDSGHQFELHAHTETDLVPCFDTGPPIHGITDDSGRQFELHAHTETDLVPRFNTGPHIDGITDNQLLYDEVIQEFSEIFSELQQARFIASIDLRNYLDEYWNPTKEQAETYRSTGDYENHFSTWNELYLDSKSKLAKNYHFVRQVSEALSHLNQVDKAIIILRIILYNTPNLKTAFKNLLIRQQAFLFFRSGRFRLALRFYMETYEHNSRVSPSAHSNISTCKNKISSSSTGSPEDKEINTWFRSLQPRVKEQSNGQWREYSYIK
ncbi:MAG: hypothetical protein ACR2PT_22045 [Endozoicomonas sp.]